MGELTVTIMDVGWGDSIIVDAVDDAGSRRFGLIDCNDYSRQTTAKHFAKWYFELAGVGWQDDRPNFEWVILTHGHSDHARGLKEMLRTFGTRHFWYPKSVGNMSHATLLNFASRSSSVENHQAIDRSKLLASPEVDFPCTMEVLWPKFDDIDASNENNNSIVLALTLGTVTIVLTGDAEAPNWPEILPRLPATTRILQAPHHGALNGVFDGAGATPWVDALDPAQVEVVMSSHVVPHGHPHPDVIDALDSAGFVAYRTDRHHAITISTDGTALDVGYSHVSGQKP